FLIPLDGVSPIAGLSLGPDGNFYGSTALGGTNGAGTIFKLTPGGTLTSLFSFNVTNGQRPVSNLTLGRDGNFYGSTVLGGANINSGTVFRFSTNGTITPLASFGGTNGANPQGQLTLAPDGDFYGTTLGGGTTGLGTVFKVTTNGALTSLLSLN